MLLGGYLYKFREDKGQKVGSEEKSFKKRSISSKMVEELMILYN